MKVAIEKPGTINKYVKVLLFDLRKVVGGP